MHTSIRRATLAIVFVVSGSLLSPPLRTQVPAQDQGAVGVWQKLRKVQTTASAMHTTAHPDDEHGGVLAMLSRGQGVRLALLTLNRGESGDNAIGAELFDAVGLIRTEELLIADRYYGVDRQYFTTMIDYGYSKRLDETLDKWGRDNVLRDVVRVIRMDRPFVLIARFQGNERDGHGNHETAGLITREAFKAAADPAMFPEQIAAGLRPWQALKLYMGGVRENEDWTLRVDTGVYDPVLGDSYQTFSRLGLSFQRSQNSGQFVPQAGPSVSYYKRLQSVVDAPAKETSFFDGIDTTIPGLYRALRKTPPAGADAALEAIDREVKAAVDSFRMTEPVGVGAGAGTSAGRDAESRASSSAAIPTWERCWRPRSSRCRRRLPPVSALPSPRWRGRPAPRSRPGRVLPSRARRRCRRSSRGRRSRCARRSSIAARCPRPPSAWRSSRKGPGARSRSRRRATRPRTCRCRRPSR